MDIVTCCECCGTEEFWQRLIDDSLAHLRGKKWYMVLLDERCEILADLLAIGSCANQHYWSLCFFELADEFFEHFFIDNWSSYLVSVSRYILDMDVFCRDIFREFDCHYSRPLRTSNLECIMHE